MKKLLIIIMIIAMLAAFTGCSENAEQEMDTEEVIEETAEEVQEEAEELASETEELAEAVEDLGSIEADESLLEMSITIPSDIMGEVTQEEVDAEVKENEYKSGTLNDDGSVTYVMSKKRHKELMDELDITLKATLEEMIGSEDYPSFTDIEVNDDYTEFTIYTSAEELSLSESFSVLGFYILGGTYNQFNGEEVDNINVKYINVDSGEIVQEGNSKDMGSE